jgi:hypothetical protein
MSVLGQLPRRGLEGLFQGTLLFGLAVTVVLHAAPVAQHLSTLAFAAIFLAYVGLFGLAYRISSRERPLPALPFVVAWIAATIALHCLYLGLVRPTLTTDFRAMWFFAQAFAEALEPGGSWPTPVHYSAQRALPVLMPLASLFGASPWVYKVGNVVLLLLASLIYYDLMRRWFGRRVAQAFLLLLLGIPELYFASGTTSHDISGLFFLSCGLWLVSSVQRQVPSLEAALSVRPWAIAGATSLALGGLLTLLQLQRSVSAFLVLAATAIVVAEAWRELSGPAARWAAARRALLRLTLIVAIPYALMTGALGILSERGLVLPNAWQQTFVAKNFASFANSFSPGTVKSDRYFRNDFLAPLSHEEIVDLGRSIFLSDTYYDAPRERPANYFTRATRLFDLGSQHNHYYPELEEDSPLSLEQAREPLDAIAEIALVVYALAGLLALFVVLFLSPPSLITLLPLTYLAGLTAGLLLFGENQPRYLFAIWLVVPGTIALAFAHRRRTRGQERYANDESGESNEGPLWLRVVSGPLLLASLLVVGWLGVRAGYGDADGRIIAGWDRFSSNTGRSQQALAEHFDRAQLGARSGAANRAFGSLVTTLELTGAAQAGETFAVERRVCRNDSARDSLAFHLFWKGFGKNLAEKVAEDPAPSAFDFSVDVDDRTVYRKSVAAVDSLGPVRIGEALGVEPCVELRLRVSATHATGRTRASRVHVYFLRLVE